MKSAVVLTLAMGAAAMHIPWVSQNDNNKQTPMIMTEEDAVMNVPREETRMPSGQGFGRGSTGDEIDVHVHLQVPHRGPNAMVSHDTPSRNAMDATGADRNNGSPSGMRTMSESANQVEMPGGSSMSSDTGSNMMPAGSPMSSDTGSNLKMMPGASSSSSNQQTNEMPGAEGMDGSHAATKGMRTMGSDTGMYGHEVCTEIEPDVPLYFQCPIPRYIKLGGEKDLCCYWDNDGDMAGNAGSGSGVMMSGKKNNFDL